LAIPQARDRRYNTKRTYYGRSGAAAEWMRTMHQALISALGRDYVN
jgi:hypothetical protein